MKPSDKWQVTSNDGTTVTLRRDTEETLEESTIERPENTDVESWKALWPVGASYGNDEFRDRVRYEAVRRKGTGVMTASEQAVVERWNRKDQPIKQVTDGMESLRVFLKNAEQVSLLEYARMVYLRYSTRPGIAADFAAINNQDSLEAFFVKHEYFLSASDIAELEARAVKTGLLTAEQLKEMRQLMKEEGQ